MYMKKEERGIYYMYKYDLRLKSILLALVMTGSYLLASCGSESEGEETTVASGDSSAEETTAEVSAFDALPAEDYDGYTFKVYLNNQDDRYVDMMTEGEETGDIFNDLIYLRNLAVEEKYNITFEMAEDDYNLVISTARESVMAGDEPWDLYFANCYAAPLAAEGYCYEMNSLPNVDLSNPWWDPAALEGMSVGGKNYIVTGDISPTSLLTSSCMVFNKRLLDESGIEYPYQSVRDGTWTLESLASITADLTRDVNGDSSYTLGDDVFGYTSWMCDSPYSFFYGAGGTLSAKDENDIPYVDYDIEKITNIYEYVYRIIVTNNSYFVTDANLYETFAQCFNDGGAYFSEITLQKIELFLRDMQDDFGIIPIPKYDEAQDEYLSCVNGAGGFIFVPANASDPARTGMIVEALAAGAYDNVTPELYDVITKTKNVRDEESAEMVDLIIKNRVFDPYYINLITGYTFMQEALQQKSEEIVSRLESYRTAAESAMEKIVETYTASQAG